MNSTTPVNPLAERLRLTLNSDELTNCMRCGFCLPACPTYQETGYEAASPRGRIALMKAASEGLIEPDAAFKQQLDLCLGCRACEPVCPSDVKYGHLLEDARDAIERHTEHRPSVKAIRKIAFKHLLPYQGRIRAAGFMLATYKKTGLQRLVRATGLLRLFPKQMRDMEQILPDGTSSGVVERLGTFIPAKGEPIAKVGLFRGCLMDMMFAGTNVNTAKLLSEAGFAVYIPPAQGCCGALHAHSGEKEDARQLAKRNIEVFKEANVDFIVSNAGGCGALLVEYDHLLGDDPAWADKAKEFAGRVKDVSQLIYDKGRVPKFNAHAAERITYQDSCHLRNVMRTSSAPRQLLNRVDGAEYVELHESDRCCGSAGIYNLTQPDMAGQILDHKMEHVETTQADILATSNPGCLLQMKLGIHQAGLANRMKAVHIVDYLYESLAKNEH